MSIASPLALWPIRFEATSYVIRCTQAGSTLNLPFPATGSLTVGRNYWMAGDGQADADGGVGGVGDLLTMLATALTAHSGASYTFACSLISDTFKLRIGTGSHGDVWSILWSHASTTLDESIFGFTNVDTTPSFAAASANVPQGIWRPAIAVEYDSLDRQPTATGITVALSGLQRGSRLALPKKVRDLRWGLLAEGKALEELEAADDPTGSFEAMWNNTLSLARPIRYYPDESASAYALYVPREDGIDYAKALQRDSRFPALFWRAELNLRRAD